MYRELKNLVLQPQLIYPLNSIDMSCTLHLLQLPGFIRVSVAEIQSNRTVPDRAIISLCIVDYYIVAVFSMYSHEVVPLSCGCLPSVGYLNQFWSLINSTLLCIRLYSPTGVNYECSTLCITMRNILLSSSLLLSVVSGKQNVLKVSHVERRDYSCAIATLSVPHLTGLLRLKIHRYISLSNHSLTLQPFSHSFVSE